MSKKIMKSMKGTLPPQEHWEVKPGDLKSGDMKYASEFGNPEDLKKSNDALVDYVKKNKMKY